jgi:PAS domain S-box-containing protein
MEFADVEGMAQALFEQTGDAMFLYDPDSHQIINANSTAQRLCGLPVRGLLRMTVSDLIRSASDEGWQQLLRAARHSLVFHSEEGYFLRAVNDEAGIPVNLTIARLHVRPKTLGLITARDVRRQHEAFHQLRKMEGELRRVLASVADCLWSAEITAAGKYAYHYISENVEKITGLPSDFYVVGFHRWYSVVHPEDQPRWSKAMARQRAGQATIEEYRVVWPDGTSRWVREKVLVSRGTAERGAAFRLDGVLSDISERKFIEHDLADKNDRFDAFMAHAPVMAFIKDADGRYHFVNEPFQRFVKKGADEIIRRKDAEIFAPELAAKLTERDVKTQKAGKPVQSVDTVRDAQGASHTWFVTRFPLNERTGRRLLGGVAVDVDELKRLQFLARD